MESDGAWREARSARASWSWARATASSWVVVPVLHLRCSHQRGAMPLCGCRTAVHDRRGHFCPVAFAPAPSLSPGRWAGVRPQSCLSAEGNGGERRGEPVLCPGAWESCVCLVCSASKALRMGGEDLARRQLWSRCSPVASCCARPALLASAEHPELESLREDTLVQHPWRIAGL